MNSIRRGLYSSWGLYPCPSMSGMGYKVMGDMLSSQFPDTTIRVFSSKKTVSSSDPEKEPIEHVRARIFGNHIGDGLRSARKILARPLIGPKVESYYPSDWFAGDPLLLDHEAEKKKSKLSRLSRRGKSPPKKGAGKRSSKK